MLGPTIRERPKDQKLGGMGERCGWQKWVYFRKLSDLYFLPAHGNRVPEMNKCPRAKMKIEEVNFVSASNMPFVPSSVTAGQNPLVQ